MSSIKTLATILAGLTAVAVLSAADPGSGTTTAQPALQHGSGEDGGGLPGGTPGVAPDERASRMRTVMRSVSEMERRAGDVEKTNSGFSTDNYMGRGPEFAELQHLGENMEVLARLMHDTMSRYEELNEDPDPDAGTNGDADVDASRDGYREANLEYLTDHAQSMVEAMDRILSAMETLGAKLQAEPPLAPGHEEEPDVEAGL